MHITADRRSQADTVHLSLDRAQNPTGRMSLLRGPSYLPPDLITNGIAAAIFQPAACLLPLVSVGRCIPPSPCAGARSTSWTTAIRPDAELVLLRISRKAPPCSPIQRSSAWAVARIKYRSSTRVGQIKLPKWPVKNIRNQNFSDWNDRRRDSLKWIWWRTVKSVAGSHAQAWC